MAMRSHSSRQSARLDAPHWLIEVGGIAKLDHIRLLAQAIKSSKFHYDADEFASKLTRDLYQSMRRVVYQAVMYVSANCPYTAPVKEVQKDGTTKMVNKEMHLTYDQTLQALVTNDAGAFKGNLQDNPSAEERSMAHKWELFRQGYYVYRDTLTRKSFELDYSQTFTCLEKPGKRCSRLCAAGQLTYKYDCSLGQKEMIREAKDRGVEIRMK